jgi:serine/threonine-protein kinase
LGALLELQQTNYAIDGGRATNTLRWTRLGTRDVVASITYEIVEAGDEQVVRLSGEIVYRTNLLSPDYEDTFRETIRAWVTARIVAALENPTMALAEADFFVDVRPHSSLTTAAEKAAEGGRHVLAFVYDPTKNERGRLAHALMYFLQNRKTRDAMNAAFVTALVPLSQLDGVTDLLDDKSMEQARWIVFDSALQPKEEAIVYPNAQEGERTIKRLAASYPSV